MFWEFDTSIWPFTAIHSLIFYFIMDWFENNNKNTSGSFTLNYYNSLESIINHKFDEIKGKMSLIKNANFAIKSLMSWISLTRWRIALFITTWYDIVFWQLLHGGNAIHRELYMCYDNTTQQVQPFIGSN